MRVEYCESCGRQTGFKRALGFGTFFAVVLTAGFWLFFIPFYPPRCVVCGMETTKFKLTVSSFILLLLGVTCALVVLMGFLSRFR